MVTFPVTLVTPNPQTTPISTFYVAFHIFVVSEHTDHFVCMLIIASPRQWMTNCP